jgi:hypothetical protein
MPVIRLVEGRVGSGMLMKLPQIMALFKPLLASLLPAKITPLGAPLLRNDPASGQMEELSPG